MGENNIVDQNFWNDRWLNENTGWDIGDVSPPIGRFIDTVIDKEIAILIPGCGNAYEAEYLLSKGFKNITLIDISPKAVERLKEKFINTSINVLCEDFFQHKEKYDLILEQTFFCAISPTMRKEYVKQMKRILNDNGQIVGVMFNTTFEKAGPPFGGSSKEYQLLFENDFEIKKMEECYNSIAPRQGKEVFIQMKKKISI